MPRQCTTASPGGLQSVATTWRCSLTERVPCTSSTRQGGSCTSAAEQRIYCARVALRSLGKQVHVSLLPHDSEPDHLATIEITGEQPPTDAEMALMNALPIRHTQRDRFEPSPLPETLIADFQDGAAAEGAWLRPIGADHGEIPTAVLLAHADDVEVADSAYRRELAAWSRSNQDGRHPAPSNPGRAHRRAGLELSAAGFRRRQNRSSPRKAVPLDHRQLNDPSSCCWVPPGTRPALGCALGKPCAGCFYGHRRRGSGLAHDAGAGGGVDTGSVHC